MGVAAGRVIVSAATWRAAPTPPPSAVSQRVALAKKIGKLTRSGHSVA